MATIFSAVERDPKLGGMVCNKRGWRSHDRAFDSGTKGNGRHYVKCLNGGGDMMPGDRKLATISFNMLCQTG
jgi:hypothetical protein